MINEKILVIDCGANAQLVARRVRACGVYSEVKPHTIMPEEIKSLRYSGIILVGATTEVDIELDSRLFELGIPVLEIGFGALLMVNALGGKVSQSDYNIVELPQGFSAMADTNGGPVVALENPDKKLYMVQSSLKIDNMKYVDDLINKFVRDICGCIDGWNMTRFVDETVAGLREKIGDKSVLCALSGGVDSTVSAVMLHKAVGDQLTCVFVDHGLLRKNESEEVERMLNDQFNMRIVKIDARERFLKKLSGVRDPESKRKIIGEEFIRVFEEQAKLIGAVDFFAQGTIYPDVIESGVGGATIKSHHNVGGLPDVIDFKELVEPLRELFKDEVRQAGIVLGIPEKLVWRQPFPGPGLGVRVIGEITEEKLEILREADAIFREEISNAELDREISQYFAVITDMRSVGVNRGSRTYDYTIVLRAVITTDFMSAQWARIPYEILDKISSRIVSEVQQVNRVVYDISNKPPATIEWE